MAPFFEKTYNLGRKKKETKTKLLEVGKAGRLPMPPLLLLLVEGRGRLSI